MEELLPVCKGAEAVLNLQPSSSISIGYHPLFGPHDDLILFELDEKLVPDVLHQRVTLRGQPDEEAVLCTKSKTYAIKFVGTSNSVFLIPPSDNPVSCDKSLGCHEGNYKEEVVATVLKVAPGTMELVEVAPKLDKLKSILLESPYCSDEVEGMGDLEVMETTSRRLYTWDDLVDRVQASDDELRAGLKAISAVEIDGCWRIVDEKYMDFILWMLLNNSVANGWSLNELIEEEVVNVLVSDGIPARLADHCLQVYGNKVVGAGRSLWRLDERRVCIQFARQILREGKRKIEIFMEEWMKKIPLGMQASFDMLEGEVLTEKLGVETWVHAFSVSSLPSNPAERFSMLFKERLKWEWKDLQPYIRDLKVPGLTSEGLLLKYTRRTQPTLDAEPVFSAR
ncbi:hypothetical protein SLE2022_106740 [Rubroshorea leprosula]